MTVSSSTYRTDTVGDGTTLPFSFTWRCDDASWVAVYLNSVLQATGYTVSLNANQDQSPGGTVTFAVAPANQVPITFLRHLPLTQTIALTPLSPFPAKVVETALDRATMVDQQLQDVVDAVPGQVSDWLTANVPGLVADQLDPIPPVNYLTLYQQDTPPAALAGALRFYATQRLGRVEPRWRTPDGTIALVQRSLGQGSIYRMVSAYGYAYLTFEGFSDVTATHAIAVAVSYATTSAYTRTKRWKQNSASGAPAMVALKNTTDGQSFLGLSDGNAGTGFYYVLRWVGGGEQHSDNRGFYGLSAQGAIPAGDPSSFTNVIGVGYDAADTHYRFMFGGSVAQGPTNTSNTFGKNVGSATVMELRICSPLGFANQINMELENLLTGEVVGVSRTADPSGVALPSPSTALGPFLMRTNGSSNALTSHEVCGIYAETPT